MGKVQALESPGDRAERLIREAQLKRDQAAAEERAVERMIRRSIEQYGP